MNENFSPVANGIIQGLEQAIQCEQNTEISDLKKSVFYRVQPRLIRQNLNMSQREFATAFGIPLSTLQNWEQGRRKIDSTAVSFLRTINQFPNEVRQALQTL